MTEKTDRNKYKQDFNKQNYERIGLYLRHDDMRRWESGAEEHGMRMSTFVKYCVEKELHSA